MGYTGLEALQGFAMLGGCCVGLLQADAIASLAELQGDAGEQLAGLATEHGRLSACLAEAEVAERKLDALAQLQQRLADFDVLLSRGARLHVTASGRICPCLGTKLV